MKRYDVKVDINVTAETFIGEEYPVGLEDMLRVIIEEQTLLATERVLREVWKARFGEEQR